LQLPRQRLVRVYPAAWDALMESRADLAADPLVRVWARNAWPLIVRRRNLSDTIGQPLGLPLPPYAGKRRIAVQLPSADIQSVTPLPAVTEVLGVAPVAWQSWLRELAGVAEKYSVHAGVFGSLGWQWLTGLNYLGPTSDVDIAWTLPGRDQIDSFLDELAQIDSRAPVRLDGELVRADGAGVNWRELHAGGAEVALKTATQVMLSSRAAFIGAAA
jgi:phosphoribosyl-dephospho-CoA transferase